LLRGRTERVGEWLCPLRQSPGTHLEPQLSGGASEPPGRLNLALHLMNKHRMFL
jgi:hypothetical protein